MIRNRVQIVRMSGKRTPVRHRSGTGLRDVSEPLEADHPHHIWTLELIPHATADGRGLRVLILKDEFTRLSPAIGVDRRMPATAFVDVLARGISRYGAPEYLRSDSAHKCVAKTIRTWLAEKRARTQYLVTGESWLDSQEDDVCIALQKECLHPEVFKSIAEARNSVEQWRRYYNAERPQPQLGNRTPVEFHAECKRQVLIQTPQEALG